ncbi:MAG: magnesium and cobalt transport protein CorA, partial [Candidatus Omnitrophica bacterium]|nr:magnesium and cobalt transport protein CorA [Candidatus Omnitrophota bacterium]
MMPKLFHRITKKPGASPGTIEYPCEQKMEKTRFRIIRYDADKINEEEFQNIDECLEYYKQAPGVKWINIDGLHDQEVFSKISKLFGVHVLAMEDAVNVTQRPKADAYDDHLFVTLKMFYVAENKIDVQAEQISFILGHDYVLSFQERVGDVFGEVRKRLRTGGTGFIRKSGADYLLYALTDAIVDHYFIVLETIGNALESADEELTERPDPKTLRRIHELKKQVVFLKKMTFPLRELFGSIMRLESKLISKKTDVFFRDVQDHSIQVLDGIESFREMISG